MEICVNYRKNNIYKIIDIIANESYIFLNIIPEVTPILDKIKDGKLPTVSKDEINLLQNYYGDDFNDYFKYEYKGNARICC